MDLEISLLCSQVPDIGSYPELDKWNPHPPNLFLWDLF
jgi:hypothetical protein